MRQLKAKQIILVFVINFIIALGFYIGNLKANYSSLSSDIQNIIPVAQKFDNPELFKKDLYLNSIENVKYYTPFYVQSLRFFAKFTDSDYVQAVNIMNAVCHLLFGIFWFFLIYRFASSFWIGIILSFIVRGVVWLPGYEIWGIADVWAMMPRTLYITFFPLAFLILNRTFKKIVLSAVLIGLVFNFHPITGLGGVLLYISFIILYVFVYNQKQLINIKNTIGLLIGLLLGMLPFLLTYFGKTSSAIDYDIDLFNQAFNSRIPGFFKNPLWFLSKWISFKTLFYVIPIVIYFIISRKDKAHRKQSLIIVLATFFLVFLPSISVYVESLINKVFDLNLRLSFQLIRCQKVAIVPSFFAMAYLLQYLNNSIKKKWFLPICTSVYLLLLIVCKLPIFNGVPFMSDNLSRLVLPNTLSFGNHNLPKENDEDRMADFIRNHTNEQAVIYGSHLYRGDCKRSVVLDYKGASMAIEGSPQRFIKWLEDKRKLAREKDIAKRIKLLKDLEVNYIVVNNKTLIDYLEVVHIEGDLILYKLQ